MTRIFTLMLVPALTILIASCTSLSNSAAETNDASDLRVMTFNIRYGTANDGVNAWPKRRHAVTSLIQKYGPDLIGLQEALRFQIDDILADLPEEYEMIGVGRDDGKTKGEYSAILYRKKRFTVNESDTFWLSDTPETIGSKSWGNNIPRICTWAQFIDHENAARPFELWNTHFDHQSPEARRRSTQLIRRKINDRSTTTPVIITGDLNAGEDSPPLRELTGGTRSDPSSLPAFIDTFRLIHHFNNDENAGERSGTFNGFVGTDDGDKIDYVLIRPGSFNVLDAFIIRDTYHPDDAPDENRYPSDHFLVFAELRFR